MLSLPPDSLLRQGPPVATRPRRAAGYNLSPATERYTVPGGGGVLVQIATGDRIEILNDEGGQPAEILAAHRDGRVDGQILGVKADQPARGLQALLSSGQPGLARLRKGLATRRITVERSIRLFGTDTAPGEKADFTVSDDGWLVVATPG